MKAIHCRRFLAFLLIFLGGMTAHASPGEKLPDNAVRAHPNLEIYTFEAADLCDSSAMQIRVNIEGVYPQGILLLEIYHGEKHFLSKKGRIRRVRVPAAMSPQQVCMTVHAAGPFAIASYHDLDANRKLKKKWNRSPKEPFGLSLNPEFKALRMPKFEESAFEVGQYGANLIIRLVSAGD